MEVQLSNTNSEIPLAILGFQISAQKTSQMGKFAMSANAKSFGVIQSRNFISANACGVSTKQCSLSVISLQHSLTHI